ncbi:MAG: IclR family transcriptional regulator [Clostridia bacterium]|nr:IclR family transcriptional regulator [Clostridia bacterium]
MGERTNIVKSIVKAFDILELLDKRNELGITEISEALGLDKSTVHRLISTLKEKGYVVQNASNNKYSNSFKLFEMGNNVVERLGFRRQAQPYLEHLARVTNETVNLAIMYDSNIIYIDKIESSATIKVDLNVGKKLPAYCTGLGKAMLAFMSQEKMEKIMADVEFIQYTNKTVADYPELLEQLKAIKQQGYSIDDEEYVEGLKCVSAPIFSYSGEVIAAISVAIPKYRYDEGEKNIGYANIIKKTAMSLSKELGYIR